MQKDPATQQLTPRLFTAALIVFGIGLIALFALFLTPIVADGDTAPTFVYVATMVCLPLGFLLGVISALAAGRRAR